VFGVLTYCRILQAGMGNIRGTINRFRGQGDGLVDWISKVRVKKNSLARRRKKNLRVEAILTSALIEAETLLRVKQQQRFQRWQRMKTEVCKADGGKVRNGTASDNLSNQWDEKTCEDIDSLNRFMCSVNEVKSPLQR
jgi:hypothetical protein